MPVNPPTDDPRVGDTWAARAPELAAWTWVRLLNRPDVWGRYGSNGTYTAPRLNLRGQVQLTEADMVRHYRARWRSDILGLHSTSPNNLSRWLVVDIDQHGPGGNDPAVNLAAALAWYVILRALGFRPILTTSNGKGGYHLRVVFREAIPTARAYTFARWLVRDFAKYGLTAPPETFPKQAQIPPSGCGNWVRLPGKHHRRDHWSTVWDGARWLAGEAAVAWLLGVEGDNPNLLPRDAEQRIVVPRRTGFLCRTAFTGGLEGRIAAYMSKLPNLGEGQGRDDVGFHLACFLVRDLRLSDEQAATWLERWDNNNVPPKGEAAINKWIASAHAYGRNEYGCGLKHTTVGKHQHIRISLEV